MVARLVRSGHGAGSFLVAVLALAIAVAAPATPTAHAALPPLDSGYALVPILDTQAPTAPTGMTWTGTTQTSISLRWNASSDNILVIGYRVYRDGTEVGTTKSTSYTVTGLQCGRSYTISLEAYDLAGNASNRAEATATTSTSACPAPPPPPPDTQAPSAPTGLTFGSATQTSVAASWNASTDNVGVTGYRRLPQRDLARDDHVAVVHGERPRVRDLVHDRGRGLRRGRQHLLAHIRHGHHRRVPTASAAASAAC